MADNHIITRKDAKERGLTRYFTGKPCKHGHIAERLTVNGSCMECTRSRVVARYWADRENNLKKQKKRRDADPNLRQKRREWRERRDPALAARNAERKRVAGLRDAARAAGETQYFTGVPCTHGHIASRFVADGGCTECNRIACRKYHHDQLHSDPERLAAHLEHQRRLKESRRRRKLREERAELWHQASRARQSAIESGDKTYLSPNPCPQKHVGERYTSTGQCVICAAAEMLTAERKAYDRAYYRKNRSRIKKRSRIYYEANSERAKESWRRWREQNPERVRAISRAYKARRRSIERAGVSGPELLAWEQAQKKVCYWCGITCAEAYHVDHYEPLSKGGAHELNNLVIACPPCNQTKSAKDPYEFAQSVGRLF